MKTFFALLATFVLFSSCYNDKGNSISQRPTVTATLKGIFSPLEDIQTCPCADNIYFLVDIKLVNTTEAHIKFLTYSCSAAENIVVEKKDIKTCVPGCSANYSEIIDLKPKEEFSLTIILKAKNGINEVKIGYVFLTPDKVRADQFILTLNNSIKSLQNVIWAEPIYLDKEHGKPYEIK